MLSICYFYFSEAIYSKETLLYKKQLNIILVNDNRKRS